MTEGLSPIPFTSNPREETYPGYRYGLTFEILIRDYIKYLAQEQVRALDILKDLGGFLPDCSESGCGIYYYYHFFFKTPDKVWEFLVRWNSDKEDSASL